MIFVIIGVLGLAFFFIPTTSGGGSLKNYPDVDPSDQGGNFSTEFDEYYQLGADSYGVPFALVKAHSIRESNQVPSAFRQEPASNGRPPSASYGLLQILWWRGSNRFSKYGFSDDRLNDGASLYNPSTNALIAAGIIRANLDQFGNLRDAINAYNTGVAESVRVAPGNYVNDVLKYYSTLTKGVVS